MKVKKGKTPFVETIVEPTPLIYAILCEQVDTVSVLLEKFHASTGVAVDGVCFLFIGFPFTLPPLFRTFAF